MNAGDVVRVHGIGTARPVTMTLDRDPVALESGEIMLCGHYRPSGTRDVWIVRVVRK